MFDVVIDATHGMVSEKQIRVQKILQDYNPGLVVLHIPPELQANQEDKDAPWCVVHVHNGGSVIIPGLGRADVVMHVRHDEFDERVLEEVFKRDMRNDPLRDIMAKNQAAAIMEAKEAQDAMDAMREVHTTILGSPLHTFKHDGKVYQ